jgi:AraC family L-rhamnose operon regulatory protein RhaS
MAQKAPIFHDDDAVYHADTCEPLRRAAADGDLILKAVGRGSYPGEKLRTPAMPELRSIGYWDAQKRQNWGLDWHRNEGVELTYIQRGRTAFSVDGKSFNLERSALTITRPWQLHRVGDPDVGPCRLVWLILDLGVRKPHQKWKWPSWMLLDARDRARLTELLRHNEQPVWQAGGDVARAFESIAALLDTGKPSPARLELVINQTWVALLDLLEKKQIALDDSLSSSRRTVDMFLKALPAHLEHPWTLDKMASECGLGRSRFVQYCRQITNLSPNDYLTECRVAAAAKRLRAEPSTSATQIALEGGFGSSQYFSTVFRKWKGLTPREWRTLRS